MSQRPSYPIAASTFAADEIEAAIAVLRSARWTMGERVLEFEREFAEWTGAPYALSVNSGSSANLLMVDAMLRRSDREAPWRAGDEVLVPALSWPTTVWPLVQLGLVPVFTDVDRRTLALDLASAESVLSPRTRGLLLVHVLGQVPNMEAIVRFCDRHGLTLLEDACESLGGHFSGRHAGAFGQMGSFSFFFSHHISTIEGGMIVASDPALYDDLCSLRAHGWIRERRDKDRWKKAHPEFDERFLFVTPGYNVRPTEIQASIGIVQLRKLDGMLEAREALARRVHGWVSKRLPWLELIGADHLPPEGTRFDRRARTHSWMALPFRVKAEAPIEPKAVVRRLEDMGVETRSIIAGNLVRHPATTRYRERSAPTLEVCDEIFSRGFMIGCHPVASAAALEALERAFEELARL